MKVQFGFKKRSLFITLFLACLAFVASAIFGWDLPIEQALSFMFWCLVLMLLVIIAAFLTVLTIKLLRRLF